MAVASQVIISRIILEIIIHCRYIRSKELILDMKRFIDRERELATLNEQHTANDAAFMVIYGRRRVGKTTLIKEFIKNKRALYFLANEETEAVSMRRFAETLAEYTGQEYLKNASFENWRDLFDIFLKHEQSEKNY